MLCKAWLRAKAATTAAAAVSARLKAEQLIPSASSRDFSKLVSAASASALLLLLLEKQQPTLQDSQARVTSLLMVKR